VPDDSSSEDHTAHRSYDRLRAATGSGYRTEPAAKDTEAVSEIVITGVRVVDLRFPTSRESIGSDAVNKDPDYSAAYCILETSNGLSGYGLTFTLGRGNEVCALALEYLARYVKGRSLSSLTDNMAAFARQLTGDSQFRWLGPEKGVIHLAAGALINAIWDLWARAEGKPLWQLLSDLDTEQLLSAERSCSVSRSESNCHSGFPSARAHRSHMALMRAPAARWITPFSGPSQRNWLSPVNCRANAAMLSVSEERLRPLTYRARYSRANAQTSLPRPRVNVRP